MNEIVNRLNKTKTERDPEFRAEREERDRKERESQKASAREIKRKEKEEADRKAKEAEERWANYFDGLVQERCNSIASAMELRLSCPNPIIWSCILWYNAVWI